MESGSLAFPSSAQGFKRSELLLGGVSSLSAPLLVSGVVIMALIWEPTFEMQRVGKGPPESEELRKKPNFGQPGPLLSFSFQTHKG